MSYMNALDLDELIGFASDLADQARPLVLNYFRRPLCVDNKADASPVTVADRETEGVLRTLIRERFPDHGLLGEEHGCEDTDSRYTWVIDPIDGTKSFISGMPTFGTLIALLAGGRPMLGVLDMPALSERWLGASGRVTLMNGSACRSRRCERLQEALLFATSIDMFNSETRQGFDEVSSRARFRRFGADCYAYGLLASGFVDLVIEADLQPYDYLPLINVIEGAGARISDWEGKPLGLNSDGRVVAAATLALHEQALNILRKSLG